MRPLCRKSLTTSTYTEPRKSDIKKQPIINNQVNFLGHLIDHNAPSPAWILQTVMGIFDKKPHYSFADVLKGLQHAVNSAQDMLQGQQVQNLTRFMNTADGTPVSQKVKLGDKEVDVPLLSLVPQCHLAMEDIEIRFNAKVSDIAPGTLQTVNGSEIPHADLKVALEGVRAKDDDVLQITVRFKQQQTPEGLSRLMDEYNKLI